MAKESKSHSDNIIIAASVGSLSLGFTPIITSLLQRRRAKVVHIHL